MGALRKSLSVDSMSLATLRRYRVLMDEAATMADLRRALEAPGLRHAAQRVVTTVGAA